MQYTTIAHIKQANQAAGERYFSKSNMRFFQSIVYEGVYGGKYFIVSNKQRADRVYNIHYPRLYDVCVINEDSEVESVAGHRELLSLATARRHAQKLAQKGTT